MSVVQNKVALVTGGASGIGLAMVKELLKNGAKGVSIVDISEETGKQAIEEITKIFDQKRVTFIKTDVTKKTELEAAFEKTVKTFGNLDIVVNNAGIVNEVNWRKTVDINLIAVIEGTYLAFLTYLPKYKSGNEGIIVNTASILGLGPLKSTPIYCTTKHGVVGLGKSLGNDFILEKYHVRILTICPGLVDTPLVRKVRGADEILFPELSGELPKVNKFAMKPERLGKGLIEVIEKGKTGSVWVVEDDDPVYQVVVPDRKSMKV